VVAEAEIVGVANWIGVVAAPSLDGVLLHGGLEKRPRAVRRIVRVGVSEDVTRELAIGVGRGPRRRKRRIAAVLRSPERPQESSDALAIAAGAIDEGAADRVALGAAVVVRARLAAKDARQRLTIGGGRLGRVRLALAQLARHRGGLALGTPTDG